MTVARVTSAVSVSGYALEVGTDSGSFAEFKSERENENAQALAAALAEEPDGERTLVGEVEQFNESATTVTGRVEQANALFRAAAEGRLLERDMLMGEIDGLLGLLERLDRGGRFEEQLRLARALHGLLAVSFRWLDLIRSLRGALRSAQIAGDEAGQAWALHELGSLHLCAGDPEKAARFLGEALRIQERLEAAGWCATRHNLDSARRDAPLPPPRIPSARWARRLVRFGALVAAVAVLGGSGTAIPGVTDPRISLASTSLNLGQVAVGNVGGDHSLRVTNAGAPPVTITRVESNHPEFRVETNCLRTLQRGEDCEVQVRFEPRAVGPLSAKLTIGGDGIRPPPVRLSGTGVGVEDATVDPKRLDLGSVPLGRQSEQQFITVTAGQRALTVDGAVADSPEFSIENGCHGTIDPKAQCTISVRFRPRETGTRRATLTISRERGKPFSVGLAGLGTTGQGAAGRLAVSPTSVEFDALRVGEKSGPRQVRVTNVGDTAITVQTPFVTGAADFELAGACGGGLEPGQSCGLQVTFAPTAAGARSAALTIQRGPGRSISVSLRGTGVRVAAQPTLMPSTHEFGSVEVLMSSKPFSFTLTAGPDTFTPRVQLSGAKDFTLGSRCGAQLAPRQFCTLEATFMPVAAGRRTATLTVSGPDGARLTATLTGAGKISQPTLTPAAHDFGTVDVGRREGPFSFTLAAGSRPLEFKASLGATKDFRLDGSCAGTLQPHAGCTLEVRFAPTASGARNATLGVTTTDGSILSSAVTGIGNVLPPAVAPKSVVDFGTIVVGRSSAARTFTVTAGSLPVGALTTSMSSKDFAVSRNGCTGTLGPFESCTFDVVFTPTAFGPRTGRVGLATLGIRETASVKGYGWAKAMWSLKPKTRELTIYSDTPGVVTVTVSRSSLAPLLLRGISLSGSNYFHASPHCPPAVGVGRTCTIAVTFAPTGGLDNTNRRATLTISTRNGGTRKVSLYGTFGVE